MERTRCFTELCPPLVGLANWRGQHHLVCATRQFIIHHPSCRLSYQGASGARTWTFSPFPSQHPPPFPPPRPRDARERAMASSPVVHRELAHVLLLTLSPRSRPLLKVSPFPKVGGTYAICLSCDIGQEQAFCDENKTSTIHTQVGDNALYCEGGNVS